MFVVFFALAADRPRPARRSRPTERPPLGAAVTVGPLGALPAAGNLFSLLDTLVPDVIADRIDAGGTGAGSPARVGAHGSTWTQTIFRVGDADITSLSGTGAPLLMPGVDVWEYVDVATGLMPLDVSAPGMAVTLTPRRPGGVVDAVARARRALHRPSPAAAPRNRRRRSRGSARSATPTSS